MFWYSIPKRWENQKINQQVKIEIYNCILQYPQAVVSPIENHCLKLSIDGKLDPKLVPKFSFHLSVRELHNRMVIPPE